MSFRIVFMGTPDFSVPTLSALLDAGHEVVAVYSQPPRPKGRGMDVQKSPVHTFAEQMGLPVFTPKSLKKNDVQNEFVSHDADLAVVIAYGLILPKAVLDAPRLGCFNIHASLLPRWRGAAPIQRAIMAGDALTGVMVMKMNEGLDTGDICLAEHIPISADMTAGMLHDHLSQLGSELIVRALAALSRDSLTLRKQPEDGVTYAAKIEKAECRIDWSKPAQDVHNHIHGLSPFPGAWFEAEINGKRERVKVLRSAVIDQEKQHDKAGELLDHDLTVSCKSGAVRLITVQRAGKKAMPGSDFLRGVGLDIGARFVE